MSTLSASTRLAVGAGAGREAFELVRAAEDAAQGKPAMLAPAAVSPFEARARRVPLALASMGSAVLRLYHPAALKASLLALDTITQAEGGSWGLGATLVIPRASGYAGSAVVALGRRSATHREALTWRGDTEQRLRYGYDAPAVSVLHASSFADAEGAAVPTPLHVGHGLFRAPRACFGTLVVSYPQGYTAWRVYYDMPGAAVEITPVAGGYRVEEPAELPPALFLATAPGYAALAEVPRERARWALPERLADSDAGDLSVTETAREADTVAVPVRDASGTQVGTASVERPRVLTFQADDGRLLRLRLVS